MAHSALPEQPHLHIAPLRAPTAPNVPHTLPHLPSLLGVAVFGNRSSRLAFGRPCCPADTSKGLFSWTDVGKLGSFSVSLDLLGSRMDLEDYLVQLLPASQNLWYSESACLGVELELSLLLVSSTPFSQKILIPTMRVLSHMSRRRHRRLKRTLEWSLKTWVYSVTLFEILSK